MVFSFSSRDFGGQTFLEYILLIGIVTGLLVAMSPMIRRFTQAMVKITADQIGNQEYSDQHAGSGYLVSSNILASESRLQTREDRLGDTTYYPSVVSSQSMNQYTDLGHSKQ